MIADIKGVGCDGILIEVVRPYHFMTGLDQSQIETSRAGEKRYHSHRIIPRHAKLREVRRRGPFWEPYADLVTDFQDATQSSRRFRTVLDCRKASITLFSLD